MAWVFLVACLICDAKKYQIPNQLIGLGYITGLFINLDKYGTSGTIYFAVKAAIPILILFLLFEIRLIGAGDIKLLSVQASMVGAALTMKTFIVSILIAGFVVLILCIRERAIITIKLHYSFYIAAAFFVLQLREELGL